MPVRTTFEWPEPDDDGESDRAKSFSDSPSVEFSDATGGERKHTGVTFESSGALLVEFTDGDIGFTNFDPDEPI